MAVDNSLTTPPRLQRYTEGSTRHCSTSLPTEQSEGLTGLIFRATDRYQHLSRKFHSHCIIGIRIGEAKKRRKGLKSANRMAPG